MSTLLTTLHSNLLNVSFAVMALSLLTDVSNVRSFPSYNLCVGLVGAYCGANSDRKTSHVSTFALLCCVSLFFDIIFCALWGSSITEGYSSSVKFSFAMMIINMFVKAGAAFVAGRIITNEGGNDSSVSSRHSGNNAYDPADVEMTSPGGINLSIEIDDNDDVNSPIISKERRSDQQRLSQPKIATPIPQVRSPPPPPPKQ